MTAFAGLRALKPESLVKRRAGVTLGKAADALDLIQENAHILRREGGELTSWRILAYLNWVNDSVRTLTGLVSENDIDRLMLTRRYELIISGASNLVSGEYEAEIERAVNGLISTELDQRCADLDLISRELRQQFGRLLGVDHILDPPGHVRLPINDDEIIDRALAFQSLATTNTTNVTLLTYDTGQSMRARGGRAAGEEVLKEPRRRSCQIAATSTAGETLVRWQRRRTPISVLFVSWLGSTR